MDAKRYRNRPETFQTVEGDFNRKMQAEIYRLSLPNAEIFQISLRSDPSSLAQMLMKPEISRSQVKVS